MNHVETLAENQEIAYPNSNFIDTEPFYDNFTTIQNSLSKQEQIFHLIEIVEDIGYNPRSIFLRSTRINELYKIILELGGANGPLVRQRRLNLDKEYFQRWYQKKYARSASIIRSLTTQIFDQNQSNISKHPSLINKYKQMNDKDILRWYGLEDIEEESSISSRQSSIDENSRESTPIQSDVGEILKPKQITIREYHSNKDLVNRSISSSQQSLNDQEYELIIPNNHSNDIYNDQEYEQIIRNHPDVYNDPHPQIITKPNPDQVTYQQNVSIRYLIPPTPPLPGPLIIREILPPRAPTPPPLIITHQDPRPPTPPPLILRELPPPLPPQQEAQVITKVLPQEPPPAPRVILEHTPPLPPKPQSIIIEKWLPYKPPPPREIIYERVIEAPIGSEFDTRLPIPVHIERENSSDQFHSQSSSLFDQFAWSTQQHLNRLQTQQQWFIDQHRRCFQNISSELTTPALIVNHPPIVRTATISSSSSSSFHQREELIYPIYM